MGQSEAAHRKNVIRTQLDGNRLSVFQIPDESIQKTFGLDTRDKNASADFAFEHAHPSLGNSFCFKGFSLGWIALGMNLRFPPILAAIQRYAYGCCQKEKDLQLNRISWSHDQQLCEFSYARERQPHVVDSRL